MGTPVRADGVPAARPPAYLTGADWTGAYVGVETGVGLGRSKVSDPYGASIFGDTVRTPEYLLGLEAGYNWQAPGTNWVYGAEGDITYQDADGSNTCFATHAPVGGVTGTLTSSNCTANPDWGGTLTGRIGYALGVSGRTLLYGKGGVAFQHNDIEATTNNAFGGTIPLTRTSTSGTRWGWTLGAGLEQMITPAWSVKFEYDYLDYGSGNLATAGTVAVTPAGAFVLIPATGTSVDQTNNVVKLALNYKLGADPHADWPGTYDLPRHSHPALVSGWSFEGGTRYYYSVGRFQKDLAAGPTVAANLISRLTYAHLTANSGELYGRANTPWGFFVKGFVGDGKISGGHMNDEDWGLGGPPFTAYSNTLSSLSGTGMNYFTVDVGADVLHGATYKVGGFIGYNRVYEQYAATDCNQISDPASGICAPAILNTPVITETDHWNSMRLGAELVAWLTPDLRLTGEAAYLPYVKFKGRDNHWLRNLVIDENGSGQGGQVEAMLDYYFCPEFSLGVGGRYWEMWTDSGSDTFDGVPTNRQDAFRYERAGVFVQATYTFDPPARQVGSLK